VRAAFRLLADSGFGGERSRGWGRAEAPEFVDGQLPGIVLPARVRRAAAALVAAPPVAAMKNEEVAPVVAASAVIDVPPDAPLTPVEIEPKSAESEPKVAAGEGEKSESDPEAPTLAVEAAEAAVETEEVAAASAVPAPEAAIAAPKEDAPVEPQTDTTEIEAPQTTAGQPYWMLSLFAPAAGDTVDWTRGDYAVIERNGRIESPVASGGLKKQVNLVAEGSVLIAASAPVGSAPDVAPDGFPHPVFRAGFAVAIPLTGDAI
jgi:hypothetical protein